MKANERFSNLIKGKEIDRLPIIEWAPYWHLTLQRWYKEGLNITADGVQGNYAVQKFFGLDGCVQTYYHFKGDNTPPPLSHGSGIMKNEADYDRISKTLFKEPSQLFDKEHYTWLKKTQEEGDTLHFFTVDGFFWMPRELFGIEPHLYSFYDYPELLHRICTDYVVWLKKVFEYVGNTFKFDFMSFAEDMSYNNGPMLSKDTFDEFLSPYYRKVVPMLKKMDTPVFIDSDGDITKAVDWYAEVGADGMFPLERQAGVDVALYIEKQPQMAFLGHFDKMCMKFGEQAMRKEFERIMPSARKGKVIPSVDHQTPPDVSIENYRTFIRLFKEYAKTI